MALMDNLHKKTRSTGPVGRIACDGLHKTPPTSAVGTPIAKHRIAADGEEPDVGLMCRDKAREELKKAIPHLQNVIQNSCHIGKDHKKKFIVETLSKLLVTFLDDSHEHVDATCMVSSESEETLYDTIGKSGVQELQSHPCFAAVVQHKWNTKWHYKCIHWLVMVFVYLPFLAGLLTALVLAARSGHPLQYRGAEGVIQGICEAISLLYILMWLGVTCLQWISKGKSVFKECKHDTCLERCCRMWHFVTLHRCFDACRILAVLLIVPTRLADSRWQWVFASIAVICNGMKLLLYCAVLKRIGPYVATLLIIGQRDLPWIVAVFVILNISIGGGLYLAFQGINIAHSENGSEIYEVWRDGFIKATVGHSTAFGYPDWFAVIVYAVFIFTITIIFGSIVTAHFTSVYATTRKQAMIYVMLNKYAIMEKVDTLLSFFPKRRTASHGNEEYGNITTPYTYAGTDSRPASELLVEQRHMQLLEHIRKLEEKIDGMTPPWLSKRST